MWGLSKKVVFRGQYPQDVICQAWQVRHLGGIMLHYSVHVFQFWQGHGNRWLIGRRGTHLRFQRNRPQTWGSSGGKRGEVVRIGSQVHIIVLGNIIERRWLLVWGLHPTYRAASAGGWGHGSRRVGGWRGWMSQGVRGWPSWRVRGVQEGGQVFVQFVRFGIGGGGGLLSPARKGQGGEIKFVSVPFPLNLRQYVFVIIIPAEKM